MNYTVVIPARYASTRLPGKPLLDIAGKPMVWHVYQRAQESVATRVVVATDDERIERVVKDFGGDVVMTSPDHPSGTDRLQEVASQLELSESEIVVNVQGDEPLIPPQLINQVAENLGQHNDCGIATLCDRISDIDTVFNPNAVKVVFDQEGKALYFSRAPIPWARGNFDDPEVARSLSPDIDYYRHIGIYAYRCEFLHNYVTWSPSMHEKAESLEQLRALSNGTQIHVSVVDEAPPAGVDTPEDLEAIRRLMTS